MNDFDLFWLSGLLEGEGSFMKGAPSAPNSVKITIEMVDEDIVQRAADIFGVKVQKLESRKEHWKRTYRATIRCGPAVDLMVLLRPHMGNRRKSQIDEVIKSYDSTRRDQRSNAAKLPPKEELEKLKECLSYQRIANLYGVSKMTIYSRIRAV